MCSSRDGDDLPQWGDHGGVDSGRGGRAHPEHQGSVFILRDAGFVMSRGKTQMSVLWTLQILITTATTCIAYHALGEVLVIMALWGEESYFYILFTSELKFRESKYLVQHHPASKRED